MEIKSAWVGQKKALRASSLLTFAKWDTGRRTSASEFAKGELNSSRPLTKIGNVLVMQEGQTLPRVLYLLLFFIPWDFCRAISKLQTTFWAGTLPPFCVNTLRIMPKSCRLRRQAQRAKPSVDHACFHWGTQIQSCSYITLAKSILDEIKLNNRVHASISHTARTHTTKLCALAASFMHWQHQPIPQWCLANLSLSSSLSSSRYIQNWTSHCL